MAEQQFLLKRRQQSSSLKLGRRHLTCDKGEQALPEAHLQSANFESAIAYAKVFQFRSSRKPLQR